MKNSSESCQVSTVSQTRALPALPMGLESQPFQRAEQRRPLRGVSSAALVSPIRCSTCAPRTQDPAGDQALRPGLPRPPASSRVEPGLLTLIELDSAAGCDGCVP